MVTFGVTRLGQNLGTGDDRALNLKIFGGEVLTSFTRKSFTESRVWTKNVGGGQTSVQFPLMGSMEAVRHVPGQSLIEEGGASPTYLQRPKFGEKVLTIDGFMTVPTFIPKIDTILNHWDARGPIVREMAWALAKKNDIENMRVLVNGSEKGATIANDPSSWGTEQARQLERPNFSNMDGGVLGAGSSMDIVDIKSTIREVAEMMDNDDVPEYGRCFAVPNDTFHLLSHDSDVINSDTNKGTGGGIAHGGNIEILHYGGFEILKTNRLRDLQKLGAVPVADSEMKGSDYTSSVFDHITGIAWQKEATGVIKAAELGLEEQYLLEYLATFMVGGFLVGRGVLHEAACYSIRNANP